MMINDTDFILTQCPLHAYRNATAAMDRSKIMSMVSDPTCKRK